MDGITNKIAIILSVVTATAFASYYIWQAVFEVPLLKSVLAITTTCVVIAAEIISLWWYLSYVHDKNKRRDMQRESMFLDMQQRRQIPPGSSY